ncbi:hypothetical protein Clacol_009791 [Clathrus columnatus]|uniref:Fatty acid hydroxylase domain-containing protein n=1 Tax=Clathrus columnatus TaxID=1419009 RepID=A0AAV5APS7_9AGAM|nr:hypothetical protein Clacol_009791 [Clathrus columnatus]
MALNSTEVVGFEFPWYHIAQETVVPGVPDHITTLLSPVIEYWIVSLIFHLIDISGWEWLEGYRVQPSSEILKKNLATKREVVETVMKMQIMQTAFGYFWQTYVGGISGAPNYAAELHEMDLLWANRLARWFGTRFAAEFLRVYGKGFAYYMYWWVYPLGQLGIAMLTSLPVPFLYRHLHSVHHRQYVPYAYGSQYNHPFEGAIVDSLSAIVSSTAAMMSERQSLVFFLIITYKGIEDHCGYQFPWHPLRLLTSNDTVFHEIHHQSLGLKSNFSQPLFTFWDRLLGTYMSQEQFEAKKAARKKKN